MEIEKDQKDFAKTWGKRIESARDVHKKKVVNWFEKVHKEYSGDATGDSDTGEKYEQVCQVIHSVEETVQPHLMFVAPKFVVKAKKDEWEKREGLVEAVMNHEYRDILPTGRKLEYENELVLIDARMLPYGVTKTSFLVSGRIIEEPQEQGFTDKMKGLFTGESAEPKQTPIIDEEKGHVTERVDPLKLFLDPMAKNLSKSKYLIEEIDATKEDLMSPRYDQEKVGKLEPNVILNGAKTSDYKNLDKFFTDNPDDSGYRVYEIHDLEQRKIHTYSEELKDFIEYDREYPVDEGSQYAFLWFNDVPNEAYPVPPLKFYRKRALEFSYIYSQVSRQIDKFMPKLGVDGTKLSPGDKERLKAGGLGSIFETVGPPGNVVQQFIFGIQKDLFNYMGMIKDMLNLESGVADYEMAVQGDDKTATESKQIQAGTMARRFKPKKRVKDFLLSQAYIILQTLQKNQTIEKFIKVLGEKDALEWFQDPETGKAGWTKEQIIGQYSFDMDVEQATPMDSAMKKKQRMEAVALVTNPNMRQMAMEEKKKLKLMPIVEKMIKEDLGINDRQSIVEDLSILSPEQELQRLLYGQQLQIQPGENLEEHLQGHIATMNAPLFKMLPQEVQSMLMDHIQQTQQAVAQKQQKQGVGKMQGKPAAPSSSVSEPTEIAMEPRA